MNEAQKGPKEKCDLTGRGETEGRGWRGQEKGVESEGQRSAGELLEYREDIANGRERQQARRICIRSTDMQTNALEKRVRPANMHRRHWEMLQYKVKLLMQLA